MYIVVTIPYKSKYFYCAKILGRPNLDSAPKQKVLSSSQSIGSSSCKQLSLHAGELWRINKFKQVGFCLRRNVVIFPTDLTLTGSEFHRVGAATEKALVPIFVLTLGTKSRLELDDRSCQE